MAAFNHQKNPLGLVDSFGRRITYLRVSVTDRCNMRCTYCLPEGFCDFGAQAAQLSWAELIRLVRCFTELGVRQVRLTGGEPLIRPGLVEGVAALKALPGLEELSLSTNGSRLAGLADGLKSAGLDRVNVSLDSLERQRFKQTTGRDALESVLAGLAEAKRVGLSPVKLNMVVHAHTAFEEVEAMWAFAAQAGFVLRLIEAMPLGATGQASLGQGLATWGPMLAERHGLLPELKSLSPGPARYWVQPQTGASLGFITPMSQHFCASCNRVRLTAEGQLHLCLGQEDQVPLGAMLRAGASEAELRAAILEGIARKPERHEFVTKPERLQRLMAQTGG